MKFENLEIAYRDKVVFSDFNLNLKIPGISAIVGPSGCGKSTLLKAVAGIQPFSGNLKIPFQKNRIGLLFQDDELLPWKNIFSNISLGLKFRKESLVEIGRKTEEWMKRIRLEGFDKRYPGSLSGGQRKRVAIAQCLILSPELVLLDEPFSSLDAVVRREIVDFIFEWIRTNKLNAILVTHDLEEAVSVADQIIILSNDAKLLEQIDVELSPVKPSERKTDPDFSHYMKRLWRAMEKSIDSYP